jgi:hypothetical protein
MYSKVLHKKPVGKNWQRPEIWQLSPKIQELLHGDKDKTVPQKI